MRSNINKLQAQRVKKYNKLCKTHINWNTRIKKRQKYVVVICMVSAASRNVEFKNAAFEKLKLTDDFISKKH